MKFLFGICIDVRQ